MTDAPIAGWYPDPRNTDAEWRWWNGRDWTHETAPRRAPGAAAPVRRALDWSDVGANPYRTASVTATTSTKNYAWTWFMVFGGYVWSLFAAVFQFIGLAIVGYTDSVLAIVVSLAAWVVAVIPMLVFAEFDGRDLKAHGVAAPSALLMFVLPNVVYYLVRRSRLARAGVRFKAPDIVFFVLYGLQVASFLIGIILIVTMLPLMFSLDTLTP